MINGSDIGMTRAEKRRQAKEDKRKNAVYNVTKVQLDAMIDEELQKRMKEQKYSSDVYSEALRDAFILMLTFPMSVLMKKYWKKSFHARIKKFLDEVLNLWDDWNNDKIDIEKLKKDLWNYGGVRLEAGEDGSDERFKTE